MTLTEEEVIAALEALGTTADEVAHSLKAKGIVGKIGDSKSCPISNYLKTIGCPEPSVFDTIYVDCNIYSDFRTPTICFEFIKKFDSLKFPELVEIK